MSRAQLLDERPEEEATETTEELTTDTVETPQEEEQPQATAPDVPEKYQGKSVEELVRKLVSYVKSLITTFRQNSQTNKHLNNSNKKTMT